MHELLGKFTILPIHGMHNDMPPSPPTSMHFWRINITPSQELGMPILQECTVIGREGDTSSYSP
jgi:hypothetical protein